MKTMRASVEDSGMYTTVLICTAAGRVAGFGLTGEIWVAHAGKVLAASQ